MGFTFKQFHIDDDLCAMKVGTDAIMLGSWINVGDASSILDIGCGSGVLSLMLAQKSKLSANIVAIDVDAGAVSQTRQNIIACPWFSRIEATNETAQAFSQHIGCRFDLIVSNPPFFPLPEKPTNAYKPTSKQRQLARANKSLLPDELVSCITRLLNTDGLFYCILPIAQAELLVEIALKTGLKPCRQLTVSSYPGKPPIRRLLAFSFGSEPCEAEVLNIHDGEGNYSAEYRRLCQPYYLIF